MLRFYEGLKDEVKDDLYREDIPDTLIEYMQCTVKIDDRLYIQRMEKRSQGLLTLR